MPLSWGFKRNSSVAETNKKEFKVVLLNLKRCDSERLPQLLIFYSFNLNNYFFLGQQGIKPAFNEALDEFKERKKDSPSAVSHVFNTNLEQ